MPGRMTLFARLASGPDKTPCERALMMQSVVDRTGPRFAKARSSAGDRPRRPPAHRGKRMMLRETSPQSELRSLWASIPRARPEVHESALRSP